MTQPTAQQTVLLTCFDLHHYYKLPSGKELCAVLNGYNQIGGIGDQNTNISTVSNSKFPLWALERTLDLVFWFGVWQKLVWPSIPFLATNPCNYIGWIKQLYNCSKQIVCSRSPDKNTRVSDQSK